MSRHATMHQRRPEATEAGANDTTPQQCHQHAAQPEPGREHALDRMHVDLVGPGEIFSLLGLRRHVSRS